MYKHCRVWQALLAAHSASLSYMNPTFVYVSASRNYGHMLQGIVNPTPSSTSRL